MKLGMFPAVAGLLSLAVPALADEPAALDEVTVSATRATTATKTDTRLVETPQSISVVTAEQFIDRSAFTMQETLRYTPGINAEAYGLDTRQDQPVARGFSSAQYWDGMRKLMGYSLIPRAEVFTLERVEVLRGPSSVLYGQGSTGGIVNMVSKRPRFEFGGEVGIQYGTHDRKQAQFDITGPITETLAGRFVGVFRDAGMQTDHVPDNRVLLNPSLAWKPTEDTTITLIGLFQRDDTASSQQFLPVVASLLAPSKDRRLKDSTFLGEPDFDKLDTKQNAGTLLVEHAFTDTLKFNGAVRYVAAHAEFNEIYPDVYSNPLDPFLDADKRILPRSAYSIVSSTKTLTTDNNITWEFATGPLEHRLLVGVDYLDFKEVSATGFDAVAPIDAYAPVYGNFIAPPLFAAPILKQSQLGFYVQDQIRYADRVSLVLGYRHDRARSLPEGSPLQVDKANSLRAGLIGEIGWGISPYVSYSESFQPLVGLDFYNVPFQPQRGRQVEGGIKWQIAPATLASVAVFGINETNRPTNDPDNVLNTIQTGRVKSQGFEFEASHEVVDDLYLTASYSYTSAKVTESTFAPEVGVQLSDTPKHLASLWGVKTFRIDQDMAVRLGAGVRYVGPTISTGVTGSLRTPSYTLADALVSLDWKQWRLSVNATNLFDKRYYSSCRTFGDCFMGNRRTVLGTVAYRF